MLQRDQRTLYRAWVPKRKLDLDLETILVGLIATSSKVFGQRGTSLQFVCFNAQTAINLFIADYHPGPD
jgi:hypothetical protein